MEITQMKNKALSVACYILPFTLFISGCLSETVSPGLEIQPTSRLGGLYEGLLIDDESGKPSENSTWYFRYFRDGTYNAMYLSAVSDTEYQAVKNSDSTVKLYLQQEEKGNFIEIGDSLIYTNVSFRACSNYPNILPSLWQKLDEGGSYSEQISKRYKVFTHEKYSTFSDYSSSTWKHSTLQHREFTRIGDENTPLPIKILVKRIE